jgi:hypothetical protein
MPVNLDVLIQDLKHRFDHIEYGQRDEISKALGDLMAQRSDVSGGICLGLSCQWIELHRDYHGMGKGEKYRVECMMRRIQDLASDSAFFYRAMNSQAQYIHDGGLGEDKRIIETAKKYKIQFDDKKTHQPGENYDDLRPLGRAVGSTHSYHLIAFGGKRGGHAICSYKSGGKLFGIGSHLYVFDPNFGEFRLESGQIIVFFRDLLSIYKHQIGISYIHTRRVGFGR